MSVKVKKTNIKAIDFIKSGAVDNGFEFYLKCKDIEHVAFVVKSHYMLGQISTELDFIEIGDFFFAVNDGNVLFDIRFDKNFSVQKLNNKSYEMVMAAA